MAEIAGAVESTRRRCSRRSRPPAPTGRRRSSPRAAATTRPATRSATRSGTEEHGFARAEERATLAQLLRAVTPREREVLRLRFEEDLTQAEIGDRIGVSQMQVSRIIRQSLARLRTVARAGAEED